MKIYPSHIAILVPSARRAAAHLKQYGFDIGELESFEETYEIYVQGQERNSLLLMEPKETGSYRKALNKRGPGLHHIAVDILNLDECLDSLGGSGWLLHLNSLKSIKDYRTVYLARPGFPGLIEVQEKEHFQDGPDFVELVALNFEKQYERLLNPIGLDKSINYTNEESYLVIRGQKIPLKSLY